MTTSFYLAGPMTGIPQFNFPAFDAAAKNLREMGLTILSPAEMDDPETRKMAMASPDGAIGSGSANGQTWGDFLARDVKIVADQASGVICLDGWQKSRGARLEVFVARLAQKPVYRYEYTALPSRMTEDELVSGINGIRSVRFP